jgi:hypothetical protein
LLPKNAEARRAGFALIQDVLSASAEISGETAKRLSRVAELFGVTQDGSSQTTRSVFDPQAKAS